MLFLSDLKNLVELFCQHNPQTVTPCRVSTIRRSKKYVELVGERQPKIVTNCLGVRVCVCLCRCLCSCVSVGLGEPRPHSSKNRAEKNRKYDYLQLNTQPTACRTQPAQPFSCWKRWCPSCIGSPPRWKLLTPLTDPRPTVSFKLPRGNSCAGVPPTSKPAAVLHFLSF